MPRHTRRARRQAREAKAYTLDAPSLTEDVDLPDVDDEQQGEGDEHDDDAPKTRSPSP
jgi:hypothetical protein